MNHSDANRDQEPQVIEAFTSAAVSALQELTQVEAVVDEIPALEFFEEHPLIAAKVRLVRALPGTMTLVLSEESGLSLASRYLPSGTELTDEMIDDVAGELANVIAGQSKTILKGTPYHFGLSIPTVRRVQGLSQLADVVSQSRAGALRVGAEQLILFIQLAPCGG